jgi:hypothetical protein
MLGYYGMLFVGKYSNKGIAVSCSYCYYSVTLWNNSQFVLYTCSMQLFLQLRHVITYSGGKQERYRWTATIQVLWKFLCLIHNSWSRGVLLLLCSYFVKLLEPIRRSHFIVREIRQLTGAIHPLVRPQDVVYISCYKATWIIQQHRVPSVLVFLKN